MTSTGRGPATKCGCGVSQTQEAVKNEGRLGDIVRTIGSRPSKVSVSLSLTRFAGRLSAMADGERARLPRKTPVLAATAATRAAVLFSAEITTPMSVLSNGWSSCRLKTSDGDSGSSQSLSTIPLVGVENDDGAGASGT